MQPLPTFWATEDRQRRLKQGSGAAWATAYACIIVPSSGSRENLTYQRTILAERYERPKLVTDRELHPDSYRRSCSRRLRVVISIKGFDSPFVRTTTPALEDGTRTILARKPGFPPL